MKIKTIIAALAVIAATAVTTACSGDDDLNTGLSVIKDSQTPQNKLDQWLYKNYVEPYNIELRYRWEDNETSMDYILVPAKYENAIRMARLLKYICFDAFDEVTGSSKFIRAYFPKQVQLVGNPGWNSNGGWMSQGSYTLGSSEGGYKINLWYVNHLGDMIYENYQPVDSVIKDRDELNKIYFHTILHEFGHVFHQKIPYSTEFNQITGTAYLGGMWSQTFHSETDPEIYARGFVTAYSSYSADEDFADLFATYICSTDSQFQAILDKATDSGRNAIKQKLTLVKNYFNENWNLDIDQLHQAVQKREDNLATMNFDNIDL